MINSWACAFFGLLDHCELLGRPRGRSSFPAVEIVERGQARASERGEILRYRGDFLEQKRFFKLRLQFNLVIAPAAEQTLGLGLRCPVCGEPLTNSLTASANCRAVALSGRTASTTRFKRRSAGGGRRRGFFPGVVLHRFEHIGQDSERSDIVVSGNAAEHGVVTGVVGQAEPVQP